MLKARASNSDCTDSFGHCNGRSINIIDDMTCKKHAFTGQLMLCNVHFYDAGNIKKESLNYIITL